VSSFIPTERLLKKYANIMLIAILMASITIAAGSHNIKIKGVIEAIDTTALTITVNSTVIQVVTDFTSISERIGEPGVGDDNCVDIDFEDLVPGDRVTVSAMLMDGVLTAKTIVVH
jgi:hypothetical protein